MLDGCECRFCCGDVGCVLLFDHGQACVQYGEGVVVSFELAGDGGEEVVDQLA